jgi:predicted RNA methylase
MSVITIIREIIYLIDERKIYLTNKDLIKICEPLGKILKGELNPHAPHELMETALNLIIQEKYAEQLQNSKQPSEKYQKILKPLISRLPTQTWRSKEQIALQQFSTPPAIGFLIADILKIKKSEIVIVLEPSAGTGSLAIWAQAVGAKVLTNEIDGRRRELLKILGFAPTGFDAEFIHDFLAPEITVDVVMINPPFSANGGRTKNSSKYGFRHVESALEKLNKGGRFGIILGEAGGLDTKTGREFCCKLIERFDVRVNIKLSGREYYKNGITVDINLIFGEKLFEPRQVDRTRAVNQIPYFSANTVEETFDKVTNLNLRFNQ